MNKPQTPAQRAYEERKARRQEIEDEKEKQKLLEIQLRNQNLLNEIDISRSAGQVIQALAGLFAGDLVVRKTDEHTFQVQPINGWK